jgi:CheY-like chemotaxis protein
MAVLLVVDDDRTVRKLICMLLQVTGHGGVEAENGLEAILLYRAAPTKYDCVLTDLDMPVMDGFQLIKLVRETTPHARIICMSGSGERTLPAGVPFLKKPFTPDGFRQIVCGVLAE